MDDHTIARRTLLRGAGLAAGGAVVGGLTTSSPVHAGGGHGRHGRAEGSWLLTRFDPADGVERAFVFNMGRGGVCTMHDISPVFITGMGAWTSHGRRVRATMWIGVEETPEAPAVTFEVKIEGEVHGDEIAGTFAYVVYLPDRTTPIGEGGGTWEGTRITA